MTPIVANKKQNQLIKDGSCVINWQDVYRFQQPIFMPTGTIVDAVGHFDNSAGNPRNPNHPPQPIGWGEKTTDEMFVAFLDVIRATDYQLLDKGGKGRE